MTGVFHDSKFFLEKNKKRLAQVNRMYVPLRRFLKQVQKIRKQ
jgi:hypothetical protein